MMKRVFLWGIISALVVLAFPFWYRELDVLLFGWGTFLERNLAAVTWNPGLFATALICSAALLLLGHWLLKALFAQAQTPAGADPASVIRWRKSWTASLYCGIWLLFMVAFGAIGLFRHVTWLRAYDGPWYKARGMVCIANLRFISGAIEQWAVENEKKMGDPVTKDDLRPYLRDAALPTCPQGGKYRVTIVGEPPTCTISAHGL